MPRHPRTRILSGLVTLAVLLTTGCTPGRGTPNASSTPDPTLTPVAATPIPSGRPVLRFAIGSDSHWGMAGTDYQQRLDAFVTEVNAENAASPLDFAVINGDIGNEKTRYLREAKPVLDGLDVPYYVTQGNNDFATAKQWQEIWGVKRNYTAVINDRLFVFATTSDGSGSQDCPAADYVEKALAEVPGLPTYLVFHVPPIDRTTLLPTCTKLQRVVVSQPRIKAVFNGHVHELDRAFDLNGLPVIFDGHIGAKTGVPYFGWRMVELLADGTISTWMTDGARRLNPQVLVPRP